jgi:acetate kinase
VTTAGKTVLAINAGSSSVKCALFTFETRPQSLARDTIEGVGASGLPSLLDWVETHTRDTSLAAIGHRIVHGGPRYHEPQPITAAFVETLTQLIPFAPNHLPDEIALIEAIGRWRPEAPQMACFDTAFHHDLPEVARRLPIPHAYDDQGVRRYGFHGLSYAFLVEELRRLAGSAAAAGKLILAHLGNGSSLAAVHEGRSIDTTMAFTPIGGVVMSTRSGDLDPGVVTYLARNEALTPDQVEDLLSHRAGLLGISGTTGDMRELLDRAPRDPASRLAVAVYGYHIRKAIGALASALGGLDTLVFSGGVGEHAPVVRGMICDGLQFLGVQLDATRNDANAEVISSPAARASVWVIPTDEELMIARAAYALLGSR